MSDARTDISGKSAVILITLNNHLAADVKYLISDQPSEYKA
jgi:hypothetical protein